jgi:ATP-dependent Zn protease
MNAIPTGGSLRLVPDVRPARTEAIHAPQQLYPDGTPEEAAAMVLVARLLRDRSGLLEDARRRGVFITIQVPSSEWVDPVADAWRRTIFRAEEVPTDGDTDELQTQSPVEWETAASYVGTSDWVEFRRDGTGRNPPGPSDGNASLRSAMLLGRSVFGFSPDPGKFLPSDLVRGADHRLCLPSLDGVALSDIAERLSGRKPGIELSDDIARRVGLDELWLAARVCNDPDAYLQQVLALAQAEDDADAPSLDDVRGMDEAVAFLRRVGTIVDACRGGTLPLSAMPSGMVLAGPPGTGKTKLAAIAAASMRIPLVTGSLGEWQAAGHLGQMLAAMRATFAEARSRAPCILLVDEVDGYGDRARLNTDKDYQFQSINAFLGELDGVQAREGVFVIGTCNDPSRLDPAIVRAGRLERVIQVPRPDSAALAAILRQYLGTHLPGTDLRRAAALGVGGTGADAMRWVRDARHRALDERRVFSEDDLLAEIRGSSHGGAESLRIAVHEAGHAVMAAIERPGSLTGVSLRASFASGGLAVMSGIGAMPTRARLLSLLRQLLGGRAAEDIWFGEPSAGAGGQAGSDLSQATALAAAMVFSLGMSGDGSLLWRGMPDPADVPDMLAARPDLEPLVEALVTEAYAAAKATLTAHHAALRRVVDALVERLALDADEVCALTEAQP